MHILISKLSHKNKRKKDILMTHKKNDKTMEKNTNNLES